MMDHQSVQGTLKATTDLKRFGNDWIEFGWVNGLTVAGGVFDGQGAASWPFNKCPIRKDCNVLPTVRSSSSYSLLSSSPISERERCITLTTYVIVLRPPHAFAERAIREQPEHGGA